MPDTGLGAKNAFLHKGHANEKKGYDLCGTKELVFVIF